jgi:hypothetical protein
MIRDRYLVFCKRCKLKIRGDSQRNSARLEKLESGGPREPPPSASHRSVRDSLSSYGSCQPSSCNLTDSSLHNKIKFLPVSRLTCSLYELTHPLRSTLITRTSSLLRDDPPLCSVSVISFLWDLHLNFSLIIETTGSQRYTQEP